MEQRGPSCVFMDTEIGADMIEHSMEVPQNVELPPDALIPPLGIYLKNMETLESYLYLPVHHSTIYNSQDMEPT